MPDLNFSQQDHVFDPQLARAITVLGAGSVGSQLVLDLARIGCTDITVWDGDIIASHNIPMSAYRLGDLLRPKVVALSELVSDATGLTLKTEQQMWNGQALKGTVASCVDSMDTRMKVWQQVKNNPFVDLFVDTRIGAEFISVFAIQPTLPADVAYYEHFLYPSSKAMLLTCGSHGIIFVSGFAAHAACAALTQWWQSGKTKRHLKMLCGHVQEV